MRWVIIVLILSSCSGYRYSQQENPLAQYGIKSLSIPMFYNYSNQPDVTGDFTRETYRLFTGFTGLKLFSGYDSRADAILIGIIKSSRRINETLIPENRRVANDRASKAIGKNRQDFYIPGSTNVKMYLHVIVIKKPTEEEIALLKSEIGEQLRMTSKIVFNVTIPLNSRYTREIFDRDGEANAVNVVATQNEGIRRSVSEDLAEQAALSIRDIILYAF